MPKVNFDRLEIPKQVLTKDSINSLAEALRNLREIVHGKEVVVAPEGVAYFECSFDRKGTPDIAGAPARSHLGCRWESVRAGESGAQNRSTRACVQNESSGLTVHFDFEQDQAESAVDFHRNNRRFSRSGGRFLGARRDRH